MFFTDLLKSFPQWGGLGASPHQGLVPSTKFPENNRETIAYCSQTIAYC